MRDGAAVDCDDEVGLVEVERGLENCAGCGRVCAVVDGFHAVGGRRGHQKLQILRGAVHTYGSHCFPRGLKQFAQGKVAANGIRVRIAVGNYHDVLGLREGFEDLCDRGWGDFHNG